MFEAQGKSDPQTLTLKSDGDKLTGSMSGGRGGSYGDDVMFKIVREFNGNLLTQEYRGTVSGSDLKLTVSGGRGGPMDVVFKK